MKSTPPKIEELIGMRLGLDELLTDMMVLGVLEKTGERSFKAAEDKGLDMKLSAAKLIRDIGMHMMAVGEAVVPSLPIKDLVDLSEREAQCLLAGYLSGAGGVAREFIRAIGDQVDEGDLREQADRLDAMDAAATAAANQNHGANLDSDG